MTWIDVSSSELTSAVLAVFLMAMILAARALASRAVHNPPRDLAIDHARAKLTAKLSSKGLAGLIVDALIESKVLPPDKSAEALNVAARKIDLRKALGDY